MKYLKITIQIIRWLAIAYTFWTGARKARLLMVGAGLWRLLRKKPLRSPIQRPEFMVLNASNSQIYRRKGWRKIERKRPVV